MKFGYQSSSISRLDPSPLRIAAAPRWIASCSGSAGRAGRTPAAIQTTDAATVRIKCYAKKKVCRTSGTLKAAISENTVSTGQPWARLVPCASP
jgi:hypothetical protein